MSGALSMRDAVLRATFSPAEARRVVRALLAAADGAIAP
jgi:hypothetical protein